MQALRKAARAMSMDAQTSGILPMEKVRRPVMIAYNAENSFISIRCYVYANSVGLLQGFWG